MSTNLLNIVNYFYSKGIIDAIKLQKMLYISFGHYSFYNKEENLFDQRIESWKYGPVIPVVYDYHNKGFFTNIVPNSVTLPENEKTVIDDIINIYNNKAPFLLVELTHQKNTPWSNSYKEGSHIEISKNEIKKYYSSFLTKTNKIVEILSTKDFENVIIDLSKT